MKPYLKKVTMTISIEDKQTLSGRLFEIVIVTFFKYCFIFNQHSDRNKDNCSKLLRLGYILFTSFTISSEIFFIHAQQF